MKERPGKSMQRLSVATMRLLSVLCESNTNRNPITGALLAKLQEITPKDRSDDYLEGFASASLEAANIAKTFGLPELVVQVYLLLGGFAARQWLIQKGLYVAPDAASASDARIEYPTVFYLNDSEPYKTDVFPPLQQGTYVRLDGARHLILGVKLHDGRQMVHLAEAEGIPSRSERDELADIGVRWPDEVDDEILRVIKQTGTKKE